MSLLASLKAARMNEVRAALDVFLHVYPEARELLVEVVQAVQVKAQRITKPEPHQAPEPDRTLGLPPPFPPEPVEKAKHRGGHPPKKVSDEDVQAIRALLMSGERREEIAKCFGVSRGYVSNVTNGRRRTDVPFTPEFAAFLKRRKSKKT